ncbi:glycosyltransferase family 4 protein [Cytobacillus firmus]|uniref:glycosyltransferase family 4 protein n=1 Tax=Cytobacillus firmus TaxID=1399 RepID=UPI00202E3424|nr:glycosyltransferase family 4 protein [Cytobacillus firmus]URT70591.1 glycosyltransferase family 4 protein [Cytobacillus firmus]
MQKILLFDASNSGHHFLYNYTVLQAIKQSNKNFDITLISPVTEQEQIDRILGLNIKLINDKKYFDGSSKKVNSLIRFIRLLRLSRKEKYHSIHFLYLDSEILNIYLLKNFLRHKNIIGTLHWFPWNAKKRYMLNTLINRKIVRSLIVHGEYTKNKFVAGSIDSVNLHSITYPNFHKPSIQEINDSKKKRVKLLAFGGLRFDKGIDILIRSLKYVKYDYELLIAGKEDYFSKGDIEELIKESGIENKVMLDLKFITDEELDNYFNKSDIVVLPYRRHFLGQSGPLTEGVARKKLIIGPKTGEIGFTLSHYNIGRTFEPENIHDLAEKMNILIKEYKKIKTSILPYQEEYIKLLSKDCFIDSYKSIYKEIDQIDTEGKY